MCAYFVSSFYLQAKFILIINLKNYEIKYEFR